MLDGNSRKLAIVDIIVLNLIILLLLHVPALRECEMACRPVGAGFYLGLGKNVSDGSPCGESQNEACIGGQCKVSW
jgi:hypothetical protein